MGPPLGGCYRTGIAKSAEWHARPGPPDPRPQGPQQSAKSHGKIEPPDFVNEFLATDDGLTLTKAFMQIEDAKLRRKIVAMVEQLAG